MTPLDDLYFEWLHAKIHVPGRPYNNHFTLLNILHATEFVWIILGDDNRLEDGLDLRKEFLLSHGAADDSALVADGCSVLEVLVAFAIRASTQSTYSEQTWFWTFLQNLGLKDSHSDDRVDAAAVTEILEQFIWRTYTPLGKGSLFPVSNSHQNVSDMRFAELWTQMGVYMTENDLI